MTTLAKFKNGSRTTPYLSSWIEDWFGKDMPSRFFGDFNTGINIPAVNIKETSEAFHVEVAAPGKVKDDFKIELDNNLLTISSEEKTEHENKDERFSRREFSFSSFRRTFTLPETVEGENISAKYKDGILMIDLPKKEQAKKKPLKTIEIS